MYSTILLFHIRLFSRLFDELFGRKMSEKWRIFTFNKLESENLYLSFLKIILTSFFFTRNAKETSEYWSSWLF